MPYCTLQDLIKRFGENELIPCELTRYYLYSTLATDEVRDRYKEAVKLLEKIAQGKMSIGIDDAGAKPTSQNTAVIESGGNVFNRQDKSFI